MSCDLIVIPGSLPSPPPPPHTHTGSPCKFNLSLCPNWSDIVQVITDNVSYIGGESTITVEVNPNVTQSYSQLFYKICYHNALEPLNTTVLACTTGSKVQFNTSAQWSKSGLAVITARVFTNGSEASILGCGRTSVTIAGTCTCMCLYVCV